MPIRTIARLTTARLSARATAANAPRPASQAVCTVELTVMAPSRTAKTARRPLESRCHSPISKGPSDSSATRWAIQVTRQSCSWVSRMLCNRSTPIQEASRPAIVTISEARARRPSGDDVSRAHSQSRPASNNTCCQSEMSQVVTKTKLFASFTLASQSAS